MVAGLLEITKLPMHLRHPQNIRMGRCLDHTGRTELGRHRCILQCYFFGHLKGFVSRLMSRQLMYFDSPQL